MSVQTLRTEEVPAGAPRAGAAQPEKAPRALRVLALAAVCLGVTALAAATFVLSYAAIRSVALQAGIAPRLARGYPLLLDAMLVIVLAAVLALRGAGLPSRLLAWLTLLVVVAAAAGADALHAAGRRLPHQAAAITAAVLPWVLVLVAFALLLAMLRHARLRRTASMPATAQPATAVPTIAVPTIAVPTTAAPSNAIVQPVLAVGGQPGPAVVADADPGIAGAARARPELAVDSDLTPDDPSTDEWASEPADGTTPQPAESLLHAGYSDGGDAESDTAEPGDTKPASSDPADAAGAAGPAVTADPADPAVTAVTAETADAGPADAGPAGADDEAAELSPAATGGPDDPDMPVFHRWWSAPTPPAGT
jgi:hypothetical protein